MATPPQDRNPRLQTVSPGRLFSLVENGHNHGRAMFEEIKSPTPLHTAPRLGRTRL
jgi:hypothetical protein